MSDDQGVLRKVAWRLVPFLCLLYIFNILNRTNINFRRKHIEGDLGISEEQFNIAYGLFYIGYLLFQMPSNLLLRRVGARRALAAMMVAWGVVSATTLFVAGRDSLYLMRALLGVAQAGFFPGVILYLTFWFPDRERARVTAFFMMAISLSGVLGNPLSGTIVHNLEGVEGLRGWQWILLLEGIPTVLLGVLVFVLLADSPTQANWLTPTESTWLTTRLAEDQQTRTARQQGRLRDAFLDYRVWLLIGVYSTVAVTTNALGAYLPRLIEKLFPQQDALGIGLLTALPHMCAMIGMTVLGTHSDRTGERRGHVAVAALVAAGGWGLTLYPSPWLSLLGLCLAQMGMMSMLPVFWTMPTAFLRGAAAAGGIALINSVANIGGFLGPTILGRTGPEAMALVLVVGAVLVLTVPAHRSA